jgi:hypothetical protein
MAKLNGKVLAVVAMMFGLGAATGCNMPGDASDAIAPEVSAEDAPVYDEDPSTPGFEQNSIRVRFWARTAPPARRVEHRGVAPSDRHFWVGGSWRWNGRQHVWTRGRWIQRRNHYNYVSPRWERRWGRYEYHPGHWVRRRR